MTRKTKFPPKLVYVVFDHNGIGDVYNDRKRAERETRLYETNVLVEYVLAATAGK